MAHRQARNNTLAVCQACDETKGHTLAEALDAAILATLEALRHGH
jgi:hypothetical protein